MSKWIKYLIAYFIGGLTLPLIASGIVRLWDWSFETGPGLWENAAGLILFAFILLVILAILVVTFFVMKMAQQNRREKRVAKSEDDSNVTTINGDNDDPKLIKAEERVERKTSSA